MPTTDPNVNFEQYVKEVVQEVNAAKSGAPTLGTPATPEPLTLNIAGQTFTYKDKADLEQALNGFTQTVGQRIGELQSQVTQVNTGEGSFVEDDTNTPTWNDQEFVDKMTKSPREGLSYWLNQELFEGKSEDAVSDLKRTLQEQELTKRTIAAYQFKESHPEFPGGNDAAQRIDQIRQSMGLPYDLNGLEAAYLVGMQRGQLPNYVQQAQVQAYQRQQEQAGQLGQNPQGYGQPQYGQPQGGADPRAFNGGFGQVNMNSQNPYAGFNPQNMGQNNPYMQAPPSVNRNSPSTFGNIDPDNLSLEQIEAIFAGAGQPVQRR